MVGVDIPPPVKTTTMKGEVFLAGIIFPLLENAVHPAIELMMEDIMDVKGGTMVKGGVDIAEVVVRVKVFDQCHEAEYVEDKAKQNPPHRHQCPCHE